MDYRQLILKKMRILDDTYELINPNDKIIVGLSGGKDSMALISLLDTYQKFNHKVFSFEALYIDLGFDSMDLSILNDYCLKHEIKLNKIKSDIFEILKHYPKNDHQLDCSRCSNLKRGAIVNYAKEHHFNKIAFAHHGDDAIETMFLNMNASAKIDTFKVKVEYEDNNITFIRPLYSTFEEDIVRLVKSEDIPFIKNACPNDQKTNREQIKKITKALYDLNPQAHNNYLKLVLDMQKNDR